MLCSIELSLEGDHPLFIKCLSHSEHLPGEAVSDFFISTEAAIVSSSTTELQLSDSVSAANTTERRGPGRPRKSPP